MARACGTCRACCKVKQITGPPTSSMNQWCPEAGDHHGGGCGIYEHRPKECRDYMCLWLGDQGTFLLDGDRPDRIGIVVEFLHRYAPDDAFVCGYRPILLVQILELKPNAAKVGRARQIVDLFLRYEAPLLIVSPSCEVRHVELTVEGEGADRRFVHAVRHSENFAAIAHQARPEHPPIRMDTGPAWLKLSAGIMLSSNSWDRLLREALADDGIELPADMNTLELKA